MTLENIDEKKCFQHMLSGYITRYVISAREKEMARFHFLFLCLSFNQQEM